MVRRLPVLVAAVALVAPACAAGRSAGVAATVTRASIVHVQTKDGITTVGRGRQWTAAGGVAAPDWATIFAVRSGRLRTLDGVTGAERASLPVAAGLRPVVAAPDGRYVALTDSPSRVGQGVMPAGRDHSTIVVAPAAPVAEAAKTISVPGNVLPEGFSPDDTRLFVIEFLPAAHPDRYRVRSLDIATGQLGPVFTYDKVVDTEEMRGLSRTQVFSDHGAGHMLYTLYSRAGGDRAGYADVHALALDSGLVHCTDLPTTFGIGAAGGAIAVSPDGARLYVASAGGDIAQIDSSGADAGADPFPILRTAHIAPGGPSRTVALTADAQTVWLALGTRLVRLSSTDLRSLSTATVVHPVDALATAPDGTLYTAAAGAISSVAPVTGRIQQVATVPTTPERLAVGP